MGGRRRSPLIFIMILNMSFTASKRLARCNASFLHLSLTAASSRGRGGGETRLLFFIFAIFAICGSRSAQRHLSVSQRATLDAVNLSSRGKRSIRTLSHSDLVPLSLSLSAGWSCRLHTSFTLFDQRNETLISQNSLPLLSPSPSLPPASFFFSRRSAQSLAVSAVARSCHLVLFVERSPPTEPTSRLIKMKMGPQSRPSISVCRLLRRRPLRIETASLNISSPLCYFLNKKPNKTQ